MLYIFILKRIQCDMNVTMIFETILIDIQGNKTPYSISGIIQGYLKLMF